MPVINSSIAQTTNITENGIHDVARYTSANVEVEPVTTSLNATPTTLAQQITPDTGVDGFDEVNISAVTSDIDNNIVPENIKKDVAILGVTGSYEGSGGGSVINHTLLSKVGKPETIIGYAESDDWETKIGQEITICDTKGGLTGSMSIDNITYMRPFTVTSGSTIAFDLPSTLYLTCANSVVYERSPKNDTVSSLAWRKNQYDSDGFVVDWTPYYTSTLNDPQVGDTIYSDAACTTVVTTIDSIA